MTRLVQIWMQPLKKYTLGLRLHPTLLCQGAAVGWGLTVSVSGDSHPPPLLADPCERWSKNGHVAQSGPVGHEGRAPGRATPFGRRVV